MYGDLTDQSAAQNRINVWHYHTWQNSNFEDNSSVAQVQRDLVVSLNQARALRVEHIAYSMQNCTQLLDHINPTRAPLLRDLDLSFRGAYVSSISLDDANPQTASGQRRLPGWPTWFAVNGVPEQHSISDIQNLSVSGHAYDVSNSEWYVFDIILAFLARMPRLRTINLTISGLTYGPRPQINFETALPKFENMEELTIGHSSIKFVHAMLSKMGTRFKALNIVGNLEPGLREDAGIIEGLEDPGDRLSVTSSSRGAASSSYMRPVDLLEVLQDLSSLSTASSGNGKPLQLARLTVASVPQPRHKKQAMRVAQAVSVLITMPLLSRLHTLIMERSIFSCLCAYASMYLSDNPLPATVRNLSINLTSWRLRETDPHVYGGCCTTVEQEFGYLGRQIERGEAKKLRRVRVMLHGRSYHGLREVWESEANGLWKGFAAACRRWRIRLLVDEVESEE